MNLLHNANGQRAGKKVRPLIEPPKNKAKPKLMTRVSDLVKWRDSPPK